MAQPDPNPAPRSRTGSRLAAVIVAMFAAMLTLVAPAMAAAPSAQDTTYLTGNAATSIFEIQVGNLALQKAGGQGAKDLATMTISDHTTALAKASALLTTLGLPVPTEPSAEQKAVYATLEATASGTAFDLAYAQAQVAGHTKSIAGTDNEVATGTDPSVVDYAKNYRPIAVSHLEMAQMVVADLTAAPTAVPAGTGGMAAASSAPVGLWIALAGVILIAGAALLAFRRRSARG